MIELDSAMIILMTEVLVGLLALAVVLLIMYGKRRSREHAAANELINRLEQAEISRGKKLGQLIRENCVIDNDKLKDILKEIGRCEQALYQQILQIFLKRDVAMLKEIDRYINKLAIPYCQVIQDANSASTSGDNEELEEAKAQISRLKKEGALLSEQLQMAMKTMDEISAEYTRVFSGKQSELELENSSKKMLRIFQEAEKTIRSSVKEIEDAEDQA